MSDPSSVVNANISHPIDQSALGKIDSTVSPDLEKMAVDPAEKTVISKSPIEPLDPFARPQSAAELAQVLIGQELDHYILDSLIGGGGMGAVFRGHDKLLDRTVAVKVIPAARRDPDTLRRFRVEAQSAAKLDNPNIARVYNFGESENWNYIIFEFVEGTNLRDLVSTQGPLSVDDAVYYLRQVAEALDHASSRNVVHRDIKPSNLLVTSEGNIKVVDMGLARITALESSHDITASGVTLGTFDYVSPEQAKDPRDADVRSDLYSLGCTFYFLLTGRPPFPEGTAVQKLFKHTSEMPNDPRHYRDDLSPELVAILFKMVAKKPADRYQSAQELIGDLQLLAEIEQLPRSRTLVGTVPLVTRFSRKTAWENALPWIVAIACLLAASTGLYMIQDWNDDFAIPPIVGLYPDDFKPISEKTFPTSPIDAEKSPDSPSPNSKVADSIGSPKSANNDRLAINKNTGEDAELSSSRPTLDKDPSESDVTITKAPSSPDATATEKDSTIKPAGIAVASKILFVVPNGMGQSPYDPKLVYSSLSEAFAVANITPNVEEIQLCGNKIESSSIRLERNGIRVTAGPGFQPTIVGQSTGEYATEGAWLDIQNYEIKFQKVHFAWTPNAPSSESAFIRCQESGKLHLSDCTVTVATNGLVPIVSLIHVSNSHQTQESEQVSGIEPFQLRFENAIVRGRCHFLRMPETLRSEINWKNGFLCVSGSMLSLEGNSVRHRSLPTVRVNLDRVTAVCGQNFAQIRISDERPNKIALLRNATNSTFWCGKDRALISAYGLAETNEILAMIDLRGSDNAYDQGIRCAVESVSVTGDSECLDFVDLTELNVPEPGIETSVRWVQPIPIEFNFAEQLPIAFRQRPGAFLPGFDEKRLPTLPSPSE